MTAAFTCYACRATYICSPARAGTPRCRSAAKAYCWWTLNPRRCQPRCRSLGKAIGKTDSHLINTAPIRLTPAAMSLRRAGLQVFAGPGARAISDAAEGAAIIAHENVLNRMSAPTAANRRPPRAIGPRTLFRATSRSFFSMENHSGCSTNPPPPATVTVWSTFDARM